MKKIATLLLLLAPAIYGQEYRGTLSGLVTDPQGSAVPGAKITALETRTGVKTTAESGSTGSYTIPFLALGQYNITGHATGFKEFNREGVTLSAGEHPQIDMHLEIGATTESITVTGEAPLLETTSPSVGQVLTTQEVEDIPVNGRTPMMLDNLALGVVSTFEPGPVRPFDNSAPNSISIGGAPSSRNEVLLNGAPNAGQTNQMAYSPPQDAVTEVRVNTFEMDAAYGHTMGGTVNLVGKGGTNSVRGSAYIYNQTSALDANSFFNNAKNVARPSYHQNQYGFTAGGPVFIPKVFDGRKKLFWFFAIEKMKDSDPANSPLETGNPENFATVPTPAEIQGDFSALLSVPGTNKYTIFDPNTGVLQGNLVARQAFPNNVIPQSRLSPVAQNLLKYFPAPNTAGLAGGLQNYVLSTVDSDGYDNELGRLDYNLSDKHRLSFDARHNYRAQNKNNFFDNAATGNYLYRINHGATLSDVYTIRPTLIMDIRANWTRYIENHQSPADGVDPASLGFPSALSQAAEFKMLPYIVFTSTSVSAGARPSYEPLGYNGDGTNYTNDFQIFSDVVKVHGNHTTKAGVDVREYRWSAYTFGNPSGTFTFCCNTAASSTAQTQNWTNNPAVSTTPSPLGQDLAAFLLGLPSSGSIDLNAQNTVQAKYLGFFVQDDWRFRPNLTLNFGLRWEHDFPETERFNRSVDGFNPTAVNPISAAASAAYAKTPQPQLPASAFTALGGLTFASAASPAIYQSTSKILSPRFGFAWTPPALRTKTSIRGGFGVFVDGILLPSPNQEGFSQQTIMPAPANSAFLTPAPATLSNPFPNGFLQPTGSSLGAGTFIGNSLSVYEPEQKNPYSMRWDLSVQRQLPSNMLLEVAYVGSHAIHLPINTQIDFLPRQYLSTATSRDSAANSLLTGTVPNPFKGLIPTNSSLNGSTVALQQLLAPFPQYPIGSGSSNGVVIQQNPVGSSYYESLNVRLEKRFSNSIMLLNNFVYSKLIDRLAYLNDSDPEPEKRVSSDSRPLRNVLAAVYLLPIGKGRAVNLRNRVVDFVAGGWGVNGTYTLQSGPLLTWGNVIYYGGPLDFNPHQPNGTAFDTTRFNTVSAQQLVFNVRTFGSQFNNLRRDPTKQIDMSMTKKFKFDERRYLELVVEAFNVTNHVTFGSPQTSPTSAQFGLITTQANTPRRMESALRLVW